MRAETRRAQEHAALILESITDSFISLDGDWRFTHVNAAAEIVNGIPREDMIGKSQWEVFPATRGTLFESELRRSRAEQVAVQFENHYEPWDRWFFVRAYPSKAGGVSVIFHDITARKRSEGALQRAHDELERRVRERTEELSRANARLGQQIAKRERVEKARTGLLRRLVVAQEEEHRRIARELHDDLTQRLAVLAIDVGALEHQPDLPRGHQDQVARTCASSWWPSPRAYTPCPANCTLPSWTTWGSPTPSARSARVSAGGTGSRSSATPRTSPSTSPARRPCASTASPRRRFGTSPATHGAFRATVRLAVDVRELVLSVRDYGVGFEVAARGKMGLGLESMRERVRLIRARLTVRSRPGVGTKITVRIPLQRSRV